MKKRMAAVCMAAVLGILSGCGGGEKADTVEFMAMDTVMRLTVCDLDAQAAQSVLEEGKQALFRLDKLLSRTSETSPVAVLNAEGRTCVEEEVWQIMEEALRYAEVTDGCFDMTVAPLVSAWGFTEAENRVPEEDEIASLLPLVGSEHIRGTKLADGVVEVSLDEGCRVDLGGIAKGYGADVIAQLYAAHGVGSGLASLGGNILAFGAKPDGKPWRVGVQDPQNPGRAEAYAAVLSVTDAFVVTSGSYERYFEEDGVRYHHIIDPASGYPADNGLVSATVVAETVAGNGTMCDALSTALFVMGEEAAVEFWRSGVCDFEMVLITEDGRVVTTAGLSEHMQPTAEDTYRYETVS